MRWRGRLSISRVWEAEVVVEDYQVHTPLEIQVEVDLAEADVRVLRHFIFDEEVNENVSPWIPDPGSLWVQVSKYYMIVDLY
jgi:hypothetical protein